MLIQYFNLILPLEVTKPQNLIYQIIVHKKKSLDNIILNSHWLTDFVNEHFCLDLIQQFDA
jgi:hypothetical protein